MFPSFLMRNVIVVIRTLWNSCKGDSGDIFLCICKRWEIMLSLSADVFRTVRVLFCIIVPHVTNNDVTAYI